MKIPLKLLTVLLLLATRALCASEHVPEFTAYYEAKVNFIPATLKMQLNLSPVPDTTDQYQLQLKGKSFIGKYRETSLFTGKECHYKTSHHEFFASGFGIKRTYTTDFNWTQLTSHFTKKKEAYDFAIQENTLDELGFYLGIRCQLKAGKTDFHLNIVRRGKLGNEHYKVIEEGNVETPVGVFHALKVRRIREDQADDSIRETDFWVAPKLDYLPIKMVHVENKSLRGTVKLTGVVIPALGINLMEDEDPKRKPGRP